MGEVINLKEFQAPKQEGNKGVDLRYKTSTSFKRISEDAKKYLVDFYSLPYGMESKINDVINDLGPDFYATMEDYYKVKNQTSGDDHEEDRRQKLLTEEMIRQIEEKLDLPNKLEAI